MKVWAPRSWKPTRNCLLIFGRDHLRGPPWWTFEVHWNRVEDIEQRMPEEGHWVFMDRRALHWRCNR